ncbi:MAG: hypothetical protein HS104_16415 [Polyangiaceae bacterium]|nr:hypothetical protein [Polyangiaceae bacterium]
MVRYDGLAEEGSGSFHPDPRERGEKRPTITIARPFYEAVNRPTRSRNAGGAHLPPPNLLAETFTLAHECGHFLSWRERAPRDEWTAYYIAAKARDDAWSQLPDDLPPPEYNERLRSSAKEQLTADQIGGLRTVGYDVALIGRHPDTEKLVNPGCTKCQAMWIDLGALAHAALPRPEWRTRFAVRPFDHSLHYSASPDAPGEVELVIEVRHRSDYACALDDCEDVCLGRLIANLRSFGITQGARALGHGTT